MMALLVKPDSRPTRGASHHFWNHIANPQPGSMPLAGCGKIYLFMKSLSVLCARLASLSVISPSGADYRGKARVRKTFFHLLGGLLDFFRAVGSFGAFSAIVSFITVVLLEPVIPVQISSGMAWNRQLTGG